MHPSSRSNGFTLVELAIALMVIGLLIGGVLKGQELIENARVTAFVRQIHAYDAATMIFRNTYGAYPGDIKKPNRIPNCTTAICNIAGDGNGKIMDYVGGGVIVTEAYNFFPHLTKAGMIQGPEGGDQAEMDAAYTDPMNAAETAIFFPESPFGLIANFDNTSLVLGHMTSKLFFNIDVKMDDGKPGTGIIRPETCPIIDEDGDGFYEDYDLSNDTTCEGWVGFSNLRSWMH